jgi:heme exporter protein B
MSLYMRQLCAIVWKDMLLEIRSRDRITAMAAFAVLAAALFSFSLDTTAVRPRDVAAGLVWMTLIFGGLLGVGRTFHLEAEDGAFQGILTSPVPKDAVFLAKVISNFLLVYALSLLSLGVFALFLAVDVSSNLGWVVLVLGLGSLGLVALSTLFSAVSTGSTMGESLLPVLVFPLLLPMVVFGAGATSRLMAGRPIGEVDGNLRMLGAFAVVAVAAGTVLFRYVVED